MDQERKEFIRLLLLHPECYPDLLRILGPSSTGKEELTALKTGEGGQHGTHESKRPA